MRLRLFDEALHFGHINTFVVETTLEKTYPYKVLWDSILVTNAKVLSTQFDAV